VKTSKYVPSSILILNITNRDHSMNFSDFFLNERINKECNSCNQSYSNSTTNVLMKASTKYLIICLQQLIYGMHITLKDFNADILKDKNIYDEDLKSVNLKLLSIIKFHNRHYTIMRRNISENNWIHIDSLNINTFGKKVKFDNSLTNVYYLLFEKI
jgi:hypothetical protein